MTLAQVGGITVSWDFNTATLVAIAVQIVIVIVYLVKTNGKANAGYELAEKAMNRANEAHDKIVIQQSSLSVFREQVARDYIDRDNLREMEDRLTDALNKVTERLDKILDRREPK